MNSGYLEVCYTQWLWGCDALGKQNINIKVPVLKQCRAKKGQSSKEQKLRVRNKNRSDVRNLKLEVRVKAFLHIRES